eukprot:2693336-Rhodomonas_salina.3
MFLGLPTLPDQHCSSFDRQLLQFLVAAILGADTVVVEAAPVALGGITDVSSGSIATVPAVTALAAPPVIVLAAIV